MHTHLRRLSSALDGTDAARVEEWGARAARALSDGQRLFACGNGGSAAEAQHLTAELTGRFENERAPLSAIALHAETSSVTAIANDYGYRQVYARQLRAHARPGDLLVCMSTSGNSENVVAAAKVAHELGVTCWSMTGPGPSALESLSDETVAVPAPSTSTVQEVHLALVHVFCAAVDREVAAREHEVFVPARRAAT
ncbi:MULTISPECIES: D-sedoheptulose-7-phosphate isomerase [Nocardiopsis]|uniref:D-sedoheptulose 7-phosphate isomerase n=1 Tax=Nocardiopsis sinuspersici TaxID=501010 RepID=A0A1V3BZ49_9ACTN|nr:MULTISPECIES: SIS domain-containing protein [Nocardiopsis]NYH54771.1 D-sedoheptulose 7-phosphate isomerase [Nocardiopsis sinuspersici]OOC53529.1 phosphoheptose isomerase [Nocardiopsis sinuspersici]